MCDKFVDSCDVRNAGKVEREFLRAFQRAQSARSRSPQGFYSHAEAGVCRPIGIEAEWNGKAPAKGSHCVLRLQGD